MKRTLLLVLSIILLSGFTFVSVSADQNNASTRQTTEPLFFNRIEDRLTVRCLLGSTYEMEFSPTKSIDVPKGNQTPTIIIQMENSPVLQRPIMILQDGPYRSNTIHLTYDEFVRAVNSKNITIRFSHLGFVRTVSFTRELSFSEEFLPTAIKSCPNSIAEWEGTYFTDQIGYSLAAALMLSYFSYLGYRLIIRGYPKLTREELINQYQPEMGSHEVITVSRTILPIVFFVLFIICTAVERPMYLLIPLNFAFLLSEAIFTGLIEVKSGIYEVGFRRKNLRYIVDSEKKFRRLSYWKTGIFSVVALLFLADMVIFFL